jgi:hypothetical protein
MRSNSLPESQLQPLQPFLWPKDLLEADSAACELVQFAHGMLQAADLPETDAHRDRKLTDFGKTFVKGLNGIISFDYAAACHDRIRQLLPELRRAFNESGVKLEFCVKLPELRGYQAQSVAEFALAIWNVAKGLYFIPKSGAKDAITNGTGIFCAPGQSGPHLDECRRRLKMLPLFDATTLCSLIRQELGIVAQLRIVSAGDGARDRDKVDGIPLEHQAATNISPRATGARGTGAEIETLPLASNPFASFSGPRQRPLLDILYNKGKVPIRDVLMVVYKTSSSDKQEALEKLITRTNKKLTQEGLQMQISRKGETLILARL